MTINIPSFQQYQQEFTAYLRDPVNRQRPKNVAPKRMNVYKELIFNNLFESVSACFPVAQKVIGKRAWLKLVRRFFCDHSSNTPIFRQIPEEFLSYLTSINCSDEPNLPPYLESLCHYEWVELLVTTMVNPTDGLLSHHRTINLTGDLLENQPAFTPTMQLLNYEYAVQKISPRYKPTDKVNTQLLVYRNADDAVNFIELNPITYRLIKLLQEKGTTSKCALNMIANELDLLQAGSVILFGLDILEALRNQGVILGVYKYN